MRDPTNKIQKPDFLLPDSENDHPEEFKIGKY